MSRGVGDCGAKSLHAVFVLECLFSRDTDISLSKLLRERMKNSDATGHYATSVSRATSFGRPVQTLLTDERSNKKV